MSCEIKYQFFLSINYTQYKGDIGEYGVNFIQQNPIGLDIFLVFTPYERFNYWYLCYEDVIAVDITCTPFEEFVFKTLKDFCKIDGYTSKATRSIRYCDNVINSIRKQIIPIASVNNQFVIECDPYYRWAVHARSHV